MPGCNHKYIGKKGIKCEKQKGHEGCHEQYFETSSSKNESNFTIYQWNDRGEAPIFAKEYGRSFRVNLELIMTALKMSGKGL